MISSVGEKNGKTKIACSFSAIKLCFVINAMNNETITLLNVAEYPLPILFNSATSAKYQAKFPVIVNKSHDQICSVLLSDFKFTCVFENIFQGS